MSSDHNVSPPKSSSNSGEIVSPQKSASNYGKNVSPPKSSSNSRENVSPPKFSSSSGEIVSPPKFSSNSGENVSPPKFSSNSGEIVSPTKFSSNSGENVSLPKFSPKYGENVYPPKFSSNSGEIIFSPKSSSNYGENVSPPKFSSNSEKHDSPPKSSSNCGENISPQKFLSNSEKHGSPPKSSSNYGENVSPPKSSSNYEKHVSPPKSSSNYEKHVSPPKSSSNSGEIVSPPKSSSNSGEKIVSPPESSSNSGRIVQALAQEDNNVSSRNQNEETEVPDNNGSTTTPLQPQEPKAKESGVARSTESLLNLVSREVEYIKGTSKTLGDYKDLVGERIPGAEKKIKQFEKELADLSEKNVADGEKEAHQKLIDEIEKELRQFKKHVRKLKLTIPPKFKINPADLPALEQNLSGSNKSVQPYSIDNKLGKLELFKEKIYYEHRSAFQDFEKRYAALDNKLKMCLLCFSVFPEDEIIKKRLMVYWWIGEGFITKINQSKNVNENKDLEQLGAECFDKLIEKDFIHSAYGKGSQEVDNCKMQPFVRWAVILMAEKAKFFKFNDDGIPTEDYDSSFRACLVGSGLDIEKNPNLEKLHMLCNVNEEILELKPEWFMKMKNVSVLCLGRWQVAAGHHIEVEETSFLEGLKNMLHLRYLSLQGISRITKLPNSLSQLGKLTILDLRACHNLEELPNDIGLLKRLTHLDLSECYLLAHMPKGISNLSNLLVLKGFLVVEHAKDKRSCTLDDLTKLTKLRKLSIFTGLAKFPEAKDLVSFGKFVVLHKLKMVWGEQHNPGRGDASTEDVKEENHIVSSSKTDIQTPANKAHKRERIVEKALVKLEKLDLQHCFPKNDIQTPANNGHNRTVEKALVKLEKLDLQCFPKKSAPYWLKPSELPKLKKLYIRGGQLHDLVVDDHDWEVRPWNVGTLRLKYLTGLRMNWTELLELFPHLIYLEKVRCPKLTLFPCDDKGVWINKRKI